MNWCRFLAYARAVLGLLLVAGTALPAQAHQAAAEPPTIVPEDAVRTEQTDDDTERQPVSRWLVGDQVPAKTDSEESILPSDWKPFWTYAQTEQGFADPPEPDLAQIKLLAEQIPDDRQVQFGVFMAQFTKPQATALLDITRHLRDFGLRGSFAQFLMALPADRQTAIIKLMARFNGKQAAAFASELVGNDPADWIAVPDFLASAGESATLPLLFGNLPCMRNYEGRPFHGCRLPAETDAFLARWGVSYVRTAYPVYAGVGFRAPPRLAPWQAEIFRSGADARALSPQEADEEKRAYGRALTDYERSHLCGGALIESGWILTAAHCIVPPNTRGILDEYMANRSVRLGTRSISAKGGTRWAVEGAVRHSRFRLSAMDKGFDIALLRIVRPRAERAGNAAMIVAPKRIRPAEPGTDRPRLKTELFVTGWGFTGLADRTNVTRTNDGKPQVPSAVLQVSQLQLLDVSQCNNDPQFIRSKYRIAPEQGQLCAGSQGIQSSCRGDSGGPLIEDADSGPVLIGLVSLGIGCGRKAAPSAFVDVAFFHDWIKQAKAHYKAGKVTLWP